MDVYQIFTTLMYRGATEDTHMVEPWGGLTGLQ